VLSPHRDDAAFSLSIAIGHWLRARHTVTVLNVFTRSRFAPFSDAAFVHENDELSYVSAMRLREDQLWVRRMQEPLGKGLKNHLHLAEVNLKDAPIRLRIAPGEATATALDPGDRAIEKIRRSLARHAEEGAVDALVIPAGVGRHVDHLAVREAVQPFTAHRAACWYEELPYAATRETAAEDREMLQGIVTGRDHPLHEMVYAGDEAKRRLVLNYASQIEDADAGVIAGASERLWGNAQWVQAFSGGENT
jgi:LmbE family N-acetylglucosaminyl deacetylase